MSEFNSLPPRRRKRKPRELRVWRSTMQVFDDVFIASPTLRYAKRFTVHKDDDLFDLHWREVGRCIEGDPFTIGVHIVPKATAVHLLPLSANGSDSTPGSTSCCAAARDIDGSHDPHVSQLCDVRPDAVAEDEEDVEARLAAAWAVACRDTPQAAAGTLTVWDGQNEKKCCVNAHGLDPLAAQKMLSEQVRALCPTPRLVSYRTSETLSIQFAGGHASVFVTGISGVSQQPYIVVGHPGLFGRILWPSVDELDTYQAILFEVVQFAWTLAISRTAGDYDEPQHFVMTPDHDCWDEFTPEIANLMNLVNTDVDTTCTAFEFFELTPEGRRTGKGGFVTTFSVPCLRRPVTFAWPLNNDQLGKRVITFHHDLPELARLLLDYDNNSR